MTTTVRILSLLSLGLALTGCGKDSSTTPSASPIGSNGITVVSPNGSESFKVGGNIHIKWTITNPNTSSASPYVRCGASEWFNLIPNGSISNLNVDTSVALPDSVYSSASKALIPFPTGTDCKLKARDYVDGTVLDTSDAAFTILAK